MRVTVVRHHEEDEAGFVADAFEARGATLTVHKFPADGPLPDPSGADHIVLLGAVWSVYDPDPDRAWIADELAWLHRADQAGVPVLGICFGAQALATAFGGEVKPAARKEIGWSYVDSLDPGLVPSGPWLEFHGDQCHLPREARLLARNELCVQAFAIGRNLAVQFHPEVDRAQLSRWLEAGGRAEAERVGQDPERFLAQTAAAEPAARERAAALVDSALRLAASA
ncbi:MAG TPA: type 1 glutamine amidotransferase [Streptosporangiaceae bacterium]|jgi:GMP synthase-like glutamine amidotransferase